MTDTSTIFQGVWAVLLGGAGAGVVFGTSWAMGRRLAARTFVTMSAVFFFLALTQFPLPDRAWLASACPLAPAAPGWTPFGSLIELARRARVAGIASALSDGRLAMSSAMNILIPGLIGMTLAPHPIRARAAVGLGLALSLGVELTQLTATWGIYPCPYRRFDVDDVLLNTLGTALGFWVAQRMGGRGGPSVRPPGGPPPSGRLRQLASSIISSRAP